jgi:S1-C subfamily serine protease
LIGVNVAIYSPSGASAGIGFAIPVDVVNRVVPRLVKDGHYSRPELGITLDDTVSEAINQKLASHGVLVLGVAAGSPAEQAGIRGTQVMADDELILGDIIQAIDGKAVNSVNELTSVLDNYQPNSKVKVTLLRDGKTAMDVDVVLKSVR